MQKLVEKLQMPEVAPFLATTKTQRDDQMIDLDKCF